MAYIPLRLPCSVKRGRKVTGGRLRSGVDEMQSNALHQVSFWSRGTGQCVSRLYNRLLFFGENEKCDNNPMLWLLATTLIFHTTSKKQLKVSEEGFPNTAVCFPGEVKPHAKWKPYLLIFYHCTVHSDIHTVHSPTDAHLLKVWL